MGCPKPGELYTQALIEGYWIVLRHAGTDHDYRVAGRGWFIRCENPAGGAPSKPPTM